MRGLVAAVAPRPGAGDLVGTVVALSAALVLVALVTVPLATVALVGLAGPAPALTVLGDTLALTVLATLLSLALAAMLACAVRTGAPGGTIIVAVCRVGVVVPPFIVPLAVAALAGRQASPSRGLALVALAQALAFLPHAFMLLTGALAAVPAELEQVAESLGASRWTTLRRITVGLAGSRLVAAAGIVLTLTLGDVAAPLLLAGDRLVLATAVVEAVARGHQAATAAAALTLGTVTAVVAVAARTWREAGGALERAAGTTPPQQRAGLALRVLLGGSAAAVVSALVVLWLLVPVASLLGGRDGAWRPSLEHWAAMLRGTGLRAVADSVLLGLGVAVVGTALALAVGWGVERRGRATAAVLAALGRLPVAVPGVVGGAGYLLAFGPPAGGLALLVLVIAAWELPLTARMARSLIASRDRAAEQVARTLGASRLTTLARVTVPGLAPAAAWLAGHGLAAGAVAVGPALVLSGSALDLGVVYLFASASAGPVGTACAIATALGAIAGAAGLLARAAAGRRPTPTLLA
jgi:iron(III) transport system permease protein